MNRVEGMYRNLNNYWKKFVVGGIMLSVLIFIFPPLYGEGYDTISSLLNGQFSHIMDKSMFYSLNDTYWGLQIFLTLILLFKVFASSATNAGGGCGGIFAPSLYLGCIAGSCLLMRPTISLLRCICRRRISPYWEWRESCPVSCTRR